MERGLSCFWIISISYHHTFNLFTNLIDKPEDIGQKVDGGLKIIKSEYSENSGIDWQIKDLLKNRNFWILTAVFSLQFSSMMAVLCSFNILCSRKRLGRSSSIYIWYVRHSAMASKVIFSWLVENKLEPRMAVTLSLALQAIGLVLITRPAIFHLNLP